MISVDVVEVVEVLAVLVAADDVVVFFAATVVDVDGRDRSAAGALEALHDASAAPATAAQIVHVRARARRDAGRSRVGDRRARAGSGSQD